MSQDFEYRFRDPIVAPESLGGQPPQHRCWVEDGVIIEQDVTVSMRDGVKI
jgi:predicted acyl esterase